MERSKAGTKGKKSPDGLNYPNQNTILINIMSNEYVNTHLLFFGFTLYPLFWDIFHFLEIKIIYIF